MSAKAPKRNISRILSELVRMSAPHEMTFAQVNYKIQISADGTGLRIMENGAAFFAILMIFFSLVKHQTSLFVRLPSILITNKPPLKLLERWHYMLIYFLFPFIYFPLLTRFPSRYLNRNIRHSTSITLRDFQQISSTTSLPHSLIVSTKYADLCSWKAECGIWEAVMHCSPQVQRCSPLFKSVS